MSFRVNMVGKVFGRLTVIEFYKSEKLKGTTSTKTWYSCACECGSKILASQGALSSGNTKSCGCIRKEFITNLKYSHGLAGTDGYNLWSSMMARCYKKSHASNKSYVSKGIEVFHKWKHSPEAFIEYIENSIGKKPSKKHSLDRIDNNAGYFPGNIRWATQTQQNLNRGISKNNKTGYRGVHNRGYGSKPFQVMFQRKYLGSFPTAKEAAIAYNIAAKKLWGDDAPQNIIP